MPIFRVDDLGSLVEELYRFYQNLGYPVAFAYIRANGLCACGDSGCALDPHLLAGDTLKEIGRSGSTNQASQLSVSPRLVIQTNFTVATEGSSVLGHIKDTVSVPILRHGNICYLFVRDASAFPNLWPVLGQPSISWVSLPPYRSDSPAGGYDLPAWLAPLSIAHDQLPLLNDLLPQSVFSRITQIQRVGIEVQQRTGEGVIPLDQIVTYAAEELQRSGQTQETLALLGAACVGELLSVGQAHRLLGHDTDELRVAILDTLFAEGDIATDELIEILYDSAVAMIIESEGIDSEGLEDEDADAAENDAEAQELEGSVHPGPMAGIGELKGNDDSASVAIYAENYLDELIESDQWDADPDDMSVTALDSDALDWEQILDGVDPATLTPLTLVAIVLDELGISRDPLTSLALLDMALTAISEPPMHPDELFGYLWPTRQALLGELEFHSVVVQLLAGILLRFEMMCEAGTLVADETFLDQLLHLNTPSLVSDLFGAPNIVFWLEKHVLQAPLVQLDTRIHKIAYVLDTVGAQIIPDVSTRYYLDLIRERIDD
ncbi:hypothetical protein [Ferrimicrobium sp.]|uniref:hypothetical protein n=1 Tax=Ferrimicrobium sp. TaxID=2926050 RepID=UPI00262BB728|nr:hypothetical protein [Ferrimicrobium sp.]